MLRSSLRRIEDDDDVEDIHQSRPTCPYVQLAIAVIQAALVDCDSADERERHSAVQFFVDERSRLPFWCALVDLDADLVRRRVLKRVEGGHRWTAREFGSRVGLRGKTGIESADTRIH
jgi:hypothetical protein